MCRCSEGASTNLLLRRPAASARPGNGLSRLLPLLKPGGAIVVDVYRLSWKSFFQGKYWLRPITRRIPPQRLFPLVERYVSAVYPLLGLAHRIVGRGPRGRWGRWSASSTRGICAPAQPLSCPCWTRSTCSAGDDHPRRSPPCAAGHGSASRRSRSSSATTASKHAGAGLADASAPFALRGLTSEPEHDRRHDQRQSINGNCDAGVEHDRGCVAEGRCIRARSAGGSIDASRGDEPLRPVVGAQALDAHDALRARRVDELVVADDDADVRGAARGGLEEHQVA